MLLPEINRDTGLSSTAAAYLTTLPVLCLGLFAPLAARSSDRFGMDRTLLASLVLLTIALAARGTGEAAILFAASILAGACIAIGNVLLPALVKRDFSDHVALMTSLYTMAITGGAAVAAGVTVPLAAGLGGNWHLALALWFIPALLAVIVASPLARGRDRVTTRRPALGHLWKSALAWQVTTFMGLQSGLAFAVLGWLSPILRERGLDGVRSGYVLSALVVAQVVSCLLVPQIAVRGRDQRALNVALAVTAVIALLGLLFAPLAWIWPLAIIQGLAQGGLLSVSLTMIVLRSRTPQVAAHLSGMAQFVGYMIAALAPWLIGLLHDWTGNFEASGALFVAICTGLVISGLGAGRRLQLGDAARPASALN
ncbi:CP family cyanate transporter-like MFS transporter [Rhodoligotrophos appendicifer]